MPGPDRHLIGLALTLSLLLQPDTVVSQSDTLFTRPIQQGFTSKLWLGAQGLGGFAVAPSPEQSMGFEYPLDAYVNHCSEITMYVGAIADTSTGPVSRYGRVVQGTGLGSVVVGNQFRNISDFYPIDTAHPWYRTSIYSTGEPNRRDYDDDVDGRIDEDPLDGVDNDGDGAVDEDYGAVSESDCYCAYVDTIRWYNVRDRESRPMGIKVWQRSFAWARGVREPILPIEFNVVNISKRPMRDVYVGFRMGSYVGPLTADRYFFRNIGGYWPEICTIWFHNPVDRGSTPFGYTVLDFPGASESGTFRYRWFASGEPQPLTDQEYYDWLSGAAFSGEPLLRPDRDRSTLSLISAFVSFGPVDTLFPGDTISVTLALVGASLLESGPDNLYDNACAAQTLFARNYYPPVVLPAPKVAVTPGSGEVKLSWSNTGDDRDPRNYWDEKSRLTNFYPPDHWRRINPPAGVASGGRIFEGFRLYRSEDPGGIATSFTLVKQWDVVDTVGPKYEYDVGIDTTFSDYGLLTGKAYWYSLTSFGIPDLYVMKYLDWDETVKDETLATRGAESSVLGSRMKVRLNFSPSNSPDRVMVVPNPYRVDHNYTFESGGWEGRGQSWREEKRLIRFIHLPLECTIRIFSLSGDAIATIHHDDPVRGEEDWNLMSESGRAIASGVYVFTVESEFGTQLGKFVVIR